MAPTRTRSPGLKSLTLLPTSWTMPTASCPRVRFSRGPMAPPTVWESEVQMRALVVLTIASFGPGRGMGFSRKPTWPIAFMINAFMLVPSFALLHQLAYGHRSAYTRKRIEFRISHPEGGNIVYRFPMRKYTLGRSQTRHRKPVFVTNGAQCVADKVGERKNVCSLSSEPLCLRCVCDTPTLCFFTYRSI